MRKKVGSCTGLVPAASPGEFLILSGSEGIIWSYSVAANRLARLALTPAFVAGRVSLDRTQIVLALGIPYEVTPASVNYFAPTQWLRVYENAEPFDYRDVQVPIPYRSIELGSDGRLVYAFGGQLISIISLADGKELHRIRIDPQWEIANVYPAQSFFVAAGGIEQKSLAGFALGSGA